MATVTHKNQPAIHATRGSVPLSGTKHAYRALKLLWPSEVEGLLAELLIPTSLHVCSGASRLGDVRFDADPAHEPDVMGDASKLPFGDRSFASVLCDPPYNGKFQWNHDVLSELARVADKRIIFQHWFIPANMHGLYKKAHRFALRHVFVWQPRTYFGRVQAISVFEDPGEEAEEAATTSQPVGDSRSPNPERGNGHMSETTVEYTCGMCGKRFRYDTENMTMCAVKHPPGTCCHQNEQPVPSHRHSSSGQNPTEEGNG